MTTALIMIAAVACLGFLIWHRLGDPVQEHEQTKRELAAAKQREFAQARRMLELREAYKLAKEELEDEPTVDQIFLTRDQLRMQRRLNNGKT
jgi:hypothetical protein